MPAAFQALSFFLTYPRIQDHSDDARLRLLQFLQQLGTTHETELAYALIARETHATGGEGLRQPQGNGDGRPSLVEDGGRGEQVDGSNQRGGRELDDGGDHHSQQQHGEGGPRSKHWHVVAHYSSKLRLGQRAFDFEGNHPNIRTIGRRKTDWTKVIAYCRKEDSSPLEHGTPRFEGHSVWAEVAAASTRSEAEEIILRAKPRDWIINRRSIDYSLDKMFPLQEDAPLHLSRCASSFCLPVEVETWQLGNFM